jgi:hypothetical protein
MKILIFGYTVLAGMLLIMEKSLASPSGFVDSEKSAWALLFFSRTERFEGTFQGIKTNGLWTWGTFTMNSERRITKLSVETENVPISADAPLRGLPFPTGKLLSHYTVTLTAIDYDGRIKAAGSYETALFSIQSVIHVVLIPGKVPKFIPYDVPAGIDFDKVEVRLADGSVFWRGRCGFDVLVDPFAPPEDFEIINARTGDVLAIGGIGGNQAPALVDEKTVNIENLGNVTEAYFYVRNTNAADGSMMKIDNLPLTEQALNSHSIDAAGGVEKLVPSKTYITDLEYDGGLIVIISDQDAKVTVRQWVENGDMPLLHLDPVENYGDKILYTDNPHIGKVIVTVTTPHTNDLFRIRFYRYREDPT